MPHPLSHKYPIPISQLCLVNTDVPAGVGAPPLDTTTEVQNPRRKLAGKVFMLIMCVWFCSCLCKVCSCVSEAFLLGLRTFSLSSLIHSPLYALRYYTGGMLPRKILKFRLYESTSEAIRDHHNHKKFMTS